MKDKTILKISGKNIHEYPEQHNSLVGVSESL